MFEKTLALMEQQRLAGVYSGYIGSFLEHGHFQRKVSGWAATVPNKEKLTADYLFDVASLTKVIGTTSVILRLLDRHELQLDDPVIRFLPQYADKRVTIRHLLTHTSDIQTWIEHRDQLAVDELKKAYLQQQASSKIGQRVSYTDTSFILLGLLLEAIYQAPLADIFQKEVFEPLGMIHTSLGSPKGSLVVPTEQINGQVLRGTVHDPKARILGEHAGNAGLFSNVADLEAFVWMYAHGGEGYISREVLQATQQDQTPNRKGKRGIGWQLVGPTHTMLFHTGYTGTFLLIDCDQQSGLIFLSNRVHPIDERQAYITHRDQLVACYLSEKEKSEE